MKCLVCASDQQEFLENLGNKALGGSLSWREAARLGELSHPRGLQNHMEKHYVAQAEVVEAEVKSTLEGLISNTQASLMVDYEHAPPDVQALILTVVHNLGGLEATKPSQGHLLDAIKKAHEIVGLKTQNQLMLEYAKKQFGGAKKALENG